VGDTELKLEDVLKDKNFTVMTRLVRLMCIICIIVIVE
jgi:hypothetical protein